MARIAHGKIADTIVEKGSLQNAWRYLQKMNLDPIVLNALEEVVKADSLLMANRSSKRRLEVKDPELYAAVARIAERGGTVQQIFEAVKQELGEDRAPSRATVHRIMVDLRLPDQMAGAAIPRLPRKRT